MKKRIRGASGLLLALVVAAGAAPAVSQTPSRTLSYQGELLLSPVQFVKNRQVE